MKNIPLKSLRFFESAARNLSFKLAAEELNVTPAAVGKQIKTLEEYLGIPLFVRMTRAIALTAEGQVVFPGVRDALNKIETTFDQLQRRDDDRILSVTTVHSFAAKWLFPRLGKFSLKHPDIDVRLTATRQVMDFSRDQVDIAIRIAPQEPKSPHLETVRLFGESFLPVSAPELLQKGPELKKPSDLRNHTLIHDDTMAVYQDCNWSDWLRAFDVADIDTSRGPRFNPSTMPIQAAINGLGVALARKSLVRDDLEQGKLVAPFEMEMPSKVAYYLLYPREYSEFDKIQKFRDWVLEEVADLA